MQSGCHDSLREMLYDSLRSRPSPLFAFGQGIIPGASVWTGTRMWCKQFRELGLSAGDRVLLCAEPSPGFVMVLVACLWEGLSLVLVDPGCDVPAAMSELDARMAVVDAEVLRCHPCLRGAAGVVVPQLAGEPSEYSGRAIAASRLAPSPRILLWLSSSGTSSKPAWWGVSDENLLAVLRSFQPHLNIDGQTVLSVLPWYRASGLVMDLLPAIFGKCMIVRDPRGGEDAELLIDQAVHWDASYCSMSAKTAKGIIESHEGRLFLESLFGGIVGGGPVTADLADVLRGTRLRVGYGQTETCGGVCLGEVGEWLAGHLGSPVGCEAGIGDDGTIHVRGANVCAAGWGADGAVMLDPERTFVTGDQARRGPKGLIWVGRTDGRSAPDLGRSTLGDSAQRAA